MSLTSEMTALADAIREKSKKTEKMNISAMTAAVQSIQTGSGGGGSSFVESIEKDVNFYDYDGTRLYSYTTDEAAALTELPTPQIEHDGITFQGWNWTLDEIKTAGVADVGAFYATDDGATHLYVTIESALRTDLTINLFADSDLSIDWGDGEISEYTNALGIDISESHTYEHPGDYIIRISGSKYRLGLNVKSAKLLTGNAEPTFKDTALYANELTKIHAGSGLYGIRGYALSYCNNLECMSVDKNSLIDTGVSSFMQCGLRFLTLPNAPYDMSNMKKLQRVSLPYNVNRADTFYTCENLRRLIIGNGITSIPSNTCRNTKSLISVICLDRITSIDSSTFGSCLSMKKLDLSNCDVVPTLSSSSSFASCPTDFEILVPASLLDDWKTATNWSVYADNIKAKEA